MSDEKSPVTFLVFFMMWAKVMHWKVPLLHVRICLWLDECKDPVRVIMIFRGAAKSTIYAVWKAYGLYKDRTTRSLIYAADDKLAGKLTRDTLNVLKRHPLCAGMLPKKPGALSFWVNGSTDARNPSIEAVGVNSNATGSRADNADFDDIEVPKNIKTADARMNLRNKIEDVTHILVPGNQKTYVGTPHTYDSIYLEQIQGGSALLKIPLFGNVKRYENTQKNTRYRFDFEPGDDGLYVIIGIHKFAKILVEDKDYKVEDGEVVFDEPPNVVLDICSDCAWPERFTRDDIQDRRKETRTLNSWDSQYLLEAKPVTELRLDPSRMIPYEIQPEIKFANNQLTMWLGKVKIYGMIAYWDCSLGKVTSDDSVLSVMLTDERGNYYWHTAEALMGDLAGFDKEGNINSGQCYRVAQIVKRLQIPRVVVETNGVGGFVPPILRKALKDTGCGVTDFHVTGNKQIRILEGFEAPLQTNHLWAHVDVINSPAYEQMRDFDPKSKDQDDDYIDSASGAILQTPVRIGKIVDKSIKQNGNLWRPQQDDIQVDVD